MLHIIHHKQMTSTVMKGDPLHPLTGDTVWWHTATKTERLMVDGGGGGDCWAPVEQGNCPSEIMSVQFQANKVTNTGRRNIPLN